jgi:hypothetical protein
MCVLSLNRREGSVCAESGQVETSFARIGAGVGTTVRVPRAVRALLLDLTVVPTPAPMLEAWCFLMNMQTPRGIRWAGYSAR